MPGSFCVPTRVVVVVVVVVVDVTVVMVVAVVVVAVVVDVVVVVAVVVVVVAVVQGLGSLAFNASIVLFFASLATSDWSCCTNLTLCAHA